MDGMVIHGPWPSMVPIGGASCHVKNESPSWQYQTLLFPLLHG